jgi:hypothetical protein
LKHFGASFLILVERDPNVYGKYLIMLYPCVKDVRRELSRRRITAFLRTGRGRSSIIQ